MVVDGCEKMCQWGDVKSSQMAFRLSCGSARAPHGGCWLRRHIAGAGRRGAAAAWGVLLHFSEGAPGKAQDRQRAVEDSTLDPAKAVEAARRMVEVEGVHAIVGPSSSANSLMVVEQVTGTAGIPIVSPSATSPTLTAVEDNDFFFRTTLSDSAQGPVLAQVTREQGYDNGDLRRGHIGIWRFTEDGQIEELGVTPVSQ